MLPLLILQIFLFPLTASWLMNNWVDSRRTLALQDAASHLGSIVQQLYFALNHPTIPVGTATSDTPELPRFIDNYYYLGNATLKQLGSAPNAGKVLEITLRLVTTGITVTASVILGSIAQWDQTSLFKSNSTFACVLATKLSTTSIKLGFGG